MGYTQVAVIIAIICIIVIRLKKEGLETQVEIKQGQLLEGTIEKHLTGEYVSFKGIPYAKPPLGQLRFAGPLPPDKWEGVRDASQHGAICVQTNLFTKAVEGSEDCLFLNVYTPNTNGKYPVMLYIPGGGFRYGSGNTEQYGPEFLVSKDVVLVTINYRLEAFGFLTLDIEDARGNAGLKDQVAAMKWVKENIAVFGGDPDSVTIFGESAGGACISYHLVSDLTKRLFHKAIAQSGVATNTWSVDAHGLDKAFLIGKLLGYDTVDRSELLKRLRSAPISDLAGISDRISSGGEITEDMKMLFLPVVEKKFSDRSSFIDEPVYSLLAKNKFHDVPTIFGMNNGEGILFLNQLYANEQKINKDFGSFIKKLTHLNLSDKSISEIKQFYFGDENFSEKTEAPMIDLRSDTSFGYAIFDFARALASKAKSPTYFYIFSHCGELSVWGRFFGVKHSTLLSHGDDLNYFFSSAINADSSKWTEDTANVIQQSTKMWTNMAKFGNPTPAVDKTLNVKWEPVKGNKIAYIDIGRKLEMKFNPMKDRMQFWDDFYNKNSDLIKCSKNPAKYSIDKDFDQCSEVY